MKKILFLSVIFSLFLTLNIHAQNPAEKTFVLNSTVTISSDSLLTYTKVALPSGDKVKSFIVSAHVSGGYEASIKSHSDEITPRMKSLIRKLSPGTKVYFEEVVGIDKKGNELSPVNYVLIIKK